MKQTLNRHSLEDIRISGGIAFSAGSLILFFLFASPARGQSTDLWSNTGGSQWLTGTNWTTGNPPGTLDIGQFAANPTGGATINIKFDNPTNNGAANEAVGAIDVTTGRPNSITFTNNSTTTAGVLTLNGATVNTTAGSLSNVILHSASTGGHNLTIQDGSSEPMALALGDATNNIVVLDATGGGNINIGDIIESASARTPLTFEGSGSNSDTVNITGVSNTFTGTISILGNGTSTTEVRFSAAGSFGNAGNTIVINGGRLSSASGNSFTLASTHAIEIGATSGTSISAVGGGTLTYNGVIADMPSTVGSWAKQGSGTLQLGGVSTYSGGTAVNNGALRLTTGANRLPTGTAVSVGQAASTNLGTFDLNGNNQQIAGLNSVSGSNVSSSKNTVTSATAATLTLGGSGSYSYGAGTAANSGVIIGDVNLVVALIGSGSQTFGDTNTYTGMTTVNSGSLIVNGSLTASPVTVGGSSGAGTPTLGGSGTIGGNLTVAAAGGGAAGHVAPGLAALTIGGNLSLAGDYDWQFDNAGFVGAPGGDYSELVLSGPSSTTLLGGILNVGLTSGNYSSPFWSSDHSWEIISDANAGNSSFAFSSINAPGATGGAFSTSLGTGASAGDVLLNWTVAVPEPGAFVLAILGLPLFYFGSRRIKPSGSTRAASTQVVSLSTKTAR